MNPRAYYLGYMTKTAATEEEAKAVAARRGALAGGATSILVASMMSGAGNHLNPTILAALGAGALAGGGVGMASYKLDAPKAPTKEEAADKKLVEALAK